MKERNKMKKLLASMIVFSLLLPFLLGSDGCSSSSSQPSAQQQEEVRRQERQERLVKMASLGEDFNPLIERNNIIFRTEITSLGNIMYLYRYSMTGQILYRVAVVGKVTSTSKRLEPTWTKTGGRRGGYGATFIVEAPDAYGTYGHSTPRIFFMDPQGNYWEMDPHDLVITNAPYQFHDTVIDYRNIDAEESNWQAKWQSKFAVLANRKFAKKAFPYT